MKKGIIFIGGLIGTGKTSLAQQLSKNLGVKYYDVDLVKKEVYPTDPNFEYNLKNNIPFSDETRVKAFKKVVEDFKKLSETEDYLVVDETLHKSSLRNILFKAAKEFYGGHLVVWVKTDENLIKERLEKKSREGHMLKDPFNMYLALKKEFEPFEKPDIIYDNNKPISESAEELTELVKEKLK